MIPCNFVYTCKFDDKRTLLINTLTGVNIVVPTRYAQALKTPASLERNRTKVVTFLLKHKFLFRNNAELSGFMAETKKKQAEIVEQMLPRFDIMPNTSCNFACGYCFEDSSIRKDKKRMSVGDVKLVFRQIKKIIQKYPKHPGQSRPIGIYGGEVFIPPNRNIVEELLRQSVRLKTKVLFVTNGYGLCDFLPLLTSYRQTIDYLQVTLDGVREHHDRSRPLRGNRPTFDRVVSGIDGAIAAGLNVRVRCNIGKANADIAKFADFIRSKGWHKNPNVIILAEPVWHLPTRGSGCDPLELPNPQFLKLLAPYSKLKNPKDGIFEFRNMLGSVFSLDEPAMPYSWPLNFACTLRHMYVFKPDGSIHSCPLFLHDPKFSVGTWSESKLTHDPTKSPLAKRRDQVVFEREGCRTCQSMMICQGGCPAFALAERGTAEEVYCTPGGGREKSFETFLKLYGSSFANRNWFELKE